MSDAEEAIRRLQQAIEENNERIRDLSREYDSLQDFERQVERQRGEFEGKLGRRAKLAEKAASLTHVRAAQVLAERTREYTMGTMSSGVEGCFAEALEDAARALSDIARDIELLQEKNQELVWRIRQAEEQLRLEQASS